MLRCKTSSENERAPGGPVSSASKSDEGREISGRAALGKYFFRTKSSVFVLALIFDTITARNVLQHGRSLSPFFCFAGASGDDFICIGQLAAAEEALAHAAPSRQ